MVILSTILLVSFALKDGDRVLFYGDSITEQRLYTTYVETFVRTRYPNLRVSFVTAGVGGDTTWGGYMGSSEERVKRDVKPQKPTRITIMLGMNDAGYVPFEARIESIFIEWYGKLLGWMNEAVPGAKYTLIRTSPFDDFTGRKSDFAGYNPTLIRFGKHVEEIANTRKYEYVDFNEPVSNAVKKAVADDAKVGESFLPDMIHPGPAGHLIMAGELLKRWGATPTVTSVKLDAANKTTEGVNATIRGFDGTAWIQKDEVLPFPLDAAMKPGAKYSRFNEELNQEVLQVLNLAEGKYRLEIDGTKVGEFSNWDLGSGINLALYDTPMMKQALEVLNLAIQRNEAFFLGWHHMLGFAGFNTEKAKAGLKDLEAQVDRKEWAMAKPKEHRYKLVKL